MLERVAYMARAELSHEVEDGAARSCRDYGHRRLNVFQCEVILICIGLLGLGTIELAFEVGEQLFQPNDAFFFAFNDAILINHLRLRGQNNSLGAKLKVRIFKNQKTEANIGVRVLNRMTGLGRPNFERIA
jgi:hypothetical protein